MNSAAQRKMQPVTIFVIGSFIVGLSVLHYNKFYRNSVIKSVEVGYCFVILSAALQQNMLDADVMSIQTPEFLWVADERREPTAQVFTDTHRRINSNPLTSSLRGNVHFSELREDERTLMTLTFMLFVITQHYLYVKITALAFNHVIAKKI